MKLRYYIEVVSIIAVHGLLSWVILYISATSDSLLLTGGLPLAFGTFSAVVFLYIFTHDRVLKIARLIEEKEQKIEEKWLHRFAHHSKLFTSIVVGVLTGPILSALTVRLLLGRYQYKYWVVIFSNFISTIFYVFLLKGALGLAL